MKTTKKLLALLLTLTLIATLIPAVFAEDNLTLTISGTKAGHTYEAYQVFTGEMSNGKLIKLAWGDGVDSTEILKALNTVPDTYKTAEDVAAALTNTDETKTTLNADAFAKIVANNLVASKAISQKSSANSTDITVSAVGYYLVKDRDNSQSGASDAYTKYILLTTGESIAVKSDVPTVVKHVKDINDSTDTSLSDWKDSADHDVNDTVNYQITGTLPSKYDDYTTYKYIFTDTMSKGLTYNKDAKVYAVGTDDTRKEITTSFTAAESTRAEDNTKYSKANVLTLTCGDLKAIKDSSGNAIVKTGCTIVVEYTCTLNNQCVIGSEGNPNKVDLTFSNNPNAGGEGSTGKTPEDENIVFTYRVDVNKVDQNNEPLEGAKFKLYKYDADTKDYTIDLGEKDGTKDKNGNVTYSWLRLDDGKYKLVETTVPDGYNGVKDQEFTITATHNDGNTPSFDALTYTKAGSSDITFDGTTATIQNRLGNTLPTTGGVGTTMFYVIGSILALGAFILLVAKKRAGRAN